MIRRAQSDHREFVTAVASLTDLPHDAHEFDGVFAWYSLIHSPDDSLAVMLAECRRVLLPGGLLLVAFQTGHGVREVGRGYRDRGHDVTLRRWSRSLDEMGAHLARAGFVGVTRFERSASASERDGQGIIVAQRE